MSWWKKESKTHFVRNTETGKVIDVYRSGDEPRESRSKTPVSNALMKQYYEKHPEERPSAKAKKRIGKVAASIDSYAQRYAKSHQGARQPPTRRSSGSPQLPLGAYSFRNNFNPIGSTFDRGRPKQSRKPQASKKYAIVGGKAYPIAGTSKKKKKKTKSGGKRRKYNPNDPFDFPDFF